MSELTAGETAAAIDSAVDRLAALPLRVLNERLCQLEATLAAGGVVSNALRQAALRKMVEHWRREQVAPTARAAGLGTLSLSIPQQKVVVDDEAAFASWLAERHPTEVEATITLTVPASHLPHVVALMDAEFATGDPAGPSLVSLAEIQERIDGGEELDAEQAGAYALLRAMLGRKVEVKPKPQFTKLLLAERCTVMAGGVDESGQPYAAAVFAEDGSVVDGVRVVPGADPTAVDVDGIPTGPQPTSISVRLEAEAKARATAAASAQFAQLLAGEQPSLDVAAAVAGGNHLDAAVDELHVPEEADAEPSYDDDGIPPDTPAIDVLGLSAWRKMRKPELQAECRRLELDDTGSVADLKGRLADWAAATAGMPA